MKVEFSPVVSFKSNLIDEVKKGNQTPVLENVNVVTKPDEFVKENSELDVEVLQTKISDFRTALKSRKWDKTYLSANETVIIKNKKIDDAVEYEISKDGTVREIGMKINPTVIMNANSEMAIYYNKIASSEIDNNNKSEKPGNVFTRGISHVWKFFSVTGTMATAVLKGAISGAVAGMTVLGASVILKTPSALKEGVKFMDVLKHPLKVAGKSGKAIAGISASLVLLGHLVAGKLQANQNTAVIDHKLKVGHRDV